MWNGNITQVFDLTHSDVRDRHVRETAEETLRKVVSSVKVSYKANTKFTCNW